MAEFVTACEANPDVLASFTSYFGGDVNKIFTIEESESAMSINIKKNSYRHRARLQQQKRINDASAFYMN
jgi:hypothetical protein